MRKLVAGDRIEAMVERTAKRGGERRLLPQSAAAVREVVGVLTT